VMIKNNPNPLVLPFKCLGCKPSIEILEGSPMVFTRILLNQTIKRQLKFKNTSAVPIKYKFNNVESLPKEFSVNIKEGKLKPSE
jgi:hydrocephalus-inducing protein